jgi:hypothetical protein
MSLQSLSRNLFKADDFLLQLFPQEDGPTRVLYDVLSPIFVTMQFGSSCCIRFEEQQRDN